MNINFKQVEQMEITGVKGLDSIRVYFEQDTESAGRVNLECYGSVWTAYWGSMSSPLKEFFLSSHNSYIIGYMIKNDEIGEIDADLIRVKIIKEIFKARRKHELTKDEAYDEYEWARSFRIPEKNIWDMELSDSQKSDQWLGEEWQLHHVPFKPTAEVVYLERILNAVKDALRLTMNKDVKPCL